MTNPVTTLAPSPVFHQDVAATGGPAVGYKLFTYQAGTTTKQTTYTDSTGGTPNTNPIILDANGNCSLWFDITKTYKCVFAPPTDTDPPTNPIWTEDDITSLEGLLAAITGAQLIGFQEPGSGPIPSTAYIKLVEQPVSLRDFSVTAGTGGDDTAAFLAAWAYAVANNKDITLNPSTNTLHIAHGGVVLNCNFVNTRMPRILTNGNAGLSIIGTGNTDAPIITITNGTPTGTGIHSWQDGYFGGAEFTSQNDVPGAVNRHGISLTGTFNFRCGPCDGVGLRGSTIQFPLAGFMGDPDPSANSNAYFEWLSGVGNFGRTFDNQNNVGMDGCIIQALLGTGNMQGGGYGLGQGTTIEQLSVASGLGAAWDDGNASGTTSSNRTLIRSAEIDSNQFGLILNKMDESEFLGWRFNMRPTNSATPLNTEGVYWPKICISLADGTSGAVGNTEFKPIFRLDPITADDIAWAIANGYPAPSGQTLGKFIETTNPGSVGGCEFKTSLLDQSGRSIKDTDLYTGFNDNSVIKIVRNGRTIYSSMNENLAIYTYTGTAPVIPYSLDASALFTTGSLIAWNSLYFDPFGNFDPVTSYLYTALYTGYLRCKMLVQIPLTAGKLFGLGFGSVSSGTVIPLAEEYFASLAVPSGAAGGLGLSYLIDKTTFVTAGDQVGAFAVQGDNVSGVSLSHVSVIRNGNYVQFEMVG